MTFGIFIIQARVVAHVHARAACRPNFCPSHEPVIIGPKLEAGRGHKGADQLGGHPVGRRRHPAGYAAVGGARCRRLPLGRPELAFGLAVFCCMPTALSSGVTLTTVRG